MHASQDKCCRIRSGSVPGDLFTPVKFLEVPTQVRKAARKAKPRIPGTDPDRILQKHLFLRGSLEGASSEDGRSSLSLQAASVSLTPPRLAIPRRCSAPPAHIPTPSCPGGLLRLLPSPTSGVRACEGRTPPPLDTHTFPGWGVRERERKNLAENPCPEVLSRSRSLRLQQMEPGGPRESSGR